MDLLVVRDMLSSLYNKKNVGDGEQMRERRGKRKREKETLSSCFIPSKKFKMQEPGVGCAT